MSEFYTEMILDNYVPIDITKRMKVKSLRYMDRAGKARRGS
jgi:hypothetical protein